MAIRFQCTCGKRISSPDASAGRKGVCPRCGQSLTVPATPVHAGQDPQGDSGTHDIDLPVLPAAPELAPPRSSPRRPSRAGVARGHGRRGRRDDPPRGMSPAKIILLVLVLLFAVPVVLGIVGAIVLGGMGGAKEAANRANCESNLKQIGLALILYRDNQGKGVRYPLHSGADFLVKTYEAGVTREPDLFLCPSSGDDNQEGALLRLGQVGPGACSYAGRRNSSQSRYPGIYTVRGATETAIASDDDEGGSRFNHDGVVIILFLDGHVERLPVDDPRVGGLGTSGLLHPLAN